MVIGKALSGFLIFIILVLFMIVSIPLGHSSCKCLQCGESMAEDKARETLGAQRFRVKRFGRGFSSLVMEDSAREVPAGPDPLHHNSVTTRP